MPLVAKIAEQERILLGRPAFGNSDICEHFCFQLFAGEP